MSKEEWLKNILLTLKSIKEFDSEVGKNIIIIKTIEELEDYITQQPQLDTDIEEALQYFEDCVTSPDGTKVDNYEHYECIKQTLQDYKQEIDRLNNRVIPALKRNYKENLELKYRSIFKQQDERNTDLHTKLSQYKELVEEYSFLKTHENSYQIRQFYKQLKQIEEE